MGLLTGYTQGNPIALPSGFFVRDFASMPRFGRALQVTVPGYVSKWPGFNHQAIGKQSHQFTTKVDIVYGMNLGDNEYMVDSTFMTWGFNVRQPMQFNLQQVANVSTT